MFVVFQWWKKNINLRLLSINLNKTNENIPQKRRHKLIARTNCFLRLKCWLRGTQNLVQSLHTSEDDRVLKTHPIIPRIIKYSDAHYYLSFRHCQSKLNELVLSHWLNTPPFRLGWVPIVSSHPHCAFNVISQGDATCEKKFKQKSKTSHEWYFGCCWDGQNQDSSSMECSPYDKACSLSS